MSRTEIDRHTTLCLPDQYNHYIQYTQTDTVNLPPHLSSHLLDYSIPVYTHTMPRCEEQGERAKSPKQLVGMTAQEERGGVIVMPVKEQDGYTGNLATKI